MAAAGAASKKKFATCNLNQVLGAPKATSSKNHGPAVRSAAVMKPVAKPKGLISLGKAPPVSNIHTRKGAAWSQLEEKAKERREEEDARKDDLAKPEWAVLDYEDLDKPLSKPEFGDDGGGAEQQEGSDGADAHSEDEDADDQFARAVESVPEPMVHVTMRTADTSEAASQTAADDTDLRSARGERQFSRSQRSYLSMEYSPSPSAVPGEEALGPAAEEHSSVQVSPTGGFGVDVTSLDARRLRTRSWADQYGSDEDELDSVPATSRPSVGDTPSASSTRPFYKAQDRSAAMAPTSQPVGAMPAPSGPPPRRPPPPGPPPPAQSEVSRAPGRVGGPPRPAGPPPPMPPPAGPPPALRGAPLGQPPATEADWAAPAAAVEGRQQERSQAPAGGSGSASRGVVPPQQQQELQQQRHRSPKFSPQEDPVVQVPQLSRHSDSRFQAPKSAPYEDPRQPPRRGHLQQRGKATPQGDHWDQQHSYSHSSSHDVDHRDRERDRDARFQSTNDEGGWRDQGGPAPKAYSAWGSAPRRPSPPAPPTEASRSRLPPGPAPIGHAGGGQADGGCWGPAVAYTPAFAPRAPADRPMSEDFANSGWKEKKLWSPPETAKSSRSSQAPGSTAGGGPRSRLRGEAALPGDGASETSPGGAAGSRRAPGARPDEAAESSHPPQPPKPPKAPKGPLEALDPDSSSSDESDGPGLPPEYAVLDMNVPRTALVINVSHVLKRLNGCCSLNQLTKNIKCFKDNTGVTLEAFLRANPMTFKLEGRIVHLLGRDGEKWKPPEEARDQNDFGKGRAKGKGKGEAKKKRSSGTNAATTWSSSGWSDWQAGAWQSDRGWQHW